MRLIVAWNARSGPGMATLFAADGSMIGFDGTTVHTAAEIELSLMSIFNAFATPPFVAKVKQVRQLTPDVAVLHAIAGMVPAGEKQTSEALNTIQTMVAQRYHDGLWRIALFQNTPAAFHGHPELRARMSEELREIK